MADERSTLETVRGEYRPRLPALLEGSIRSLSIEEGESSGATGDADQIRARFPRTFGRGAVRFGQGRGPARVRPLCVGVVLSGGQAPGGHNVVAGLFDALAELHRGARLIGFRGGPKGIFNEQFETLTAERVEPYRNTGGFDLLGSGRDKIDTEEELTVCRKVAEKLGLDGLVVVGGDDSNTNAALLAEHFVKNGSETAVVGVPKTIDGDLKNGLVEISFGFDTATKLYSQLIGNISRDAKSAGKYWHFVKLMGRSASHVTLECALRTRPNVALIGEEIAERKMSLADVVDLLVDAVRRRAEAGRPYGVCLVAEGLIEFIPEMRLLITELNQILSRRAPAQGGGLADAQRSVVRQLSGDSGRVFESLPERIRRQLLLDRDSHGNVQVSKIDTEQLLIEQVGSRIAEMNRSGEFDGRFQTQHHFFGYEGRCAAPSNFDADYTQALGRLAAALVAFGKTGYMCSIGNLAAPAARWQPRGIPLTSMMQVELRKGQPTPVIAKALVRTDGRPFVEFASHRADWGLEDRYLYPGPIQYFGPPEVSDNRTLTLLLESGEGPE